MKLSIQQVHPPQISESLSEFPDARNNTGLKWFHSKRFDLFLYGDIEKKKPVGQCLFYFKNLHQDLPTIIATKIEEKGIYSPDTLLLYSDKSYYLGTIISDGISPPRADGNGILITKKFIYKGEFKDGYPQGYGTYKTRGGILVGQFMKGQPHGKCVQRTKKGLFVGDFINKFRKNGKLISPANEVSYVNEEYNVGGLMMVEL